MMEWLRGGGEVVVVGELGMGMGMRGSAVGGLLGLLWGIWFSKYKWVISCHLFLRLCFCVVLTAFPFFWFWIFCCFRDECADSGAV